MGGLVENEVCPVFVARAAGTVAAPDPDEVDDVTWVPWSEFSEEVLAGRRIVSPWCTEQVPLLDALGPDPLDWPTADRADLPPAALLVPEPPTRSRRAEAPVDDRYQYLLLMAGCVAVTLPLEFVLRARVYRRPVRLLAALLPVVVALRRVGRPRHRPGPLDLQRALHHRASCCRSTSRSRSSSSSSSSRSAGC